MTRPTSFRKFLKKCVVVFVERPTNLLARAQVWSNYKHHSTVKVLIRITPRGREPYHMYQKVLEAEYQIKKLLKNQHLLISFYQVTHNI